MDTPGFILTLTVGVMACFCIGSLCMIAYHHFFCKNCYDCRNLRVDNMLTLHNRPAQQCRVTKEWFKDSLIPPRFRRCSKFEAK